MILRASAACGIALLALGLSIGAGPQPPRAAPFALYDPNPAHLWNRIHDQLQVRKRWSRWFTQAIAAAEAKRRRYDWGVLVTHARTSIP
jgi:hypothetical protein